MNPSNILIKGAFIVNEGEIQVKDVWIKNERIEKIESSIHLDLEFVKEINAEGLYLLPGMIDDQVHFREPGLTYKGDIFSESRAAVAGGITSFMEMPNTSPPALTQKLLKDKYSLGHENSLANFSFYMGVSNDNFEEVIKTDPRTRCGIKIFLGSSTGNMLVDKEEILDRIFRNCPNLIAVHCEDEATIQRNLEMAKVEFGDAIPIQMHPRIRSEEACYLSSSFAVKLAKANGTRLHILHISTEKELDLFEPGPIHGKKITAEACIHHLWFSDQDYARLGSKIKWNPAVKKESDRAALQKGVIEGRIDVIATDHAPHTWEEKLRPYLLCPSGGPLVQHALVSLLELYHEGVFSLEMIAHKTAHAVADCFKIENRGFIREGYFADLVLANLNKPSKVKTDNILYKCGWSPFEGNTFRSQIEYTLVNGNIAYEKGKINEFYRGEELRFL